MKMYNYLGAALFFCAASMLMQAEAAHPMFDKVIARYNNNITWQQAKEQAMTPKELFIVKLADKYGVIGRNGREILPVNYDKILKFNERIIFIKRDGKDGLTDLAGQEILPVIYDEIKPYKDNLLMIEQNGKRGIADQEGNIIIPVQYDKIYLQNDKFYISKDGRHGVAAKDGHIIWPCNYFKVADSGNGGYIIGSKHAYAYYNKQGKQITKAEFAEARPFHEGLAAVKQGELFGYINEAGEMVIKPQFTQAWNFREGAAYVEKEDEHYFINEQGEKLFAAPEGKFIFGYRDGSAVFKHDGTFKFIDHEGQELFAIKAATFLKRPNGMIAITRTRHNISLGGFLQSAFTMLAGIPTIPGLGKSLYDTDIKLGYTDAKGNELIPTTNDFNSHIIDDRVVTIVKDKAGILNTDGSYYIPAQYDDLSELDFDSQKIALFRNADEYGFYQSGTGVLYNGYLAAENFVNGLAPVQLTESRWNYIDLEGNYLSTAQYWGYATPFYGTYAIVKNLDGRYAIIDQQGKQVTVLSRDLQEVQALYPDTAIVKKHNQYGVIDAQGKYLLPPKYDKISYL